MVCDHCGNREVLTPRAETIREIAIAEGLDAGSAQQEETTVLDCTNCGAQVEFDPDIHAAECPFCATPVVTGTGVNRHIKPAAVLPFRLEERAAHDAMNDWLGSLWFAPNGLQRYARKGRKLSGIYVPFWTFDAQTDTAYEGQRGDTYYVRQTVMRDGRPVSVSVPKIRWSHRRGRVRRFFDDVVVLASTSLPKRHTDGLEPWDLSGLAPYAPQFLAGFRAEAYQVGLEDGLVEARARMEAVIARDVRMDIGGDQQRITAMRTSLSGVTFKHVLLPVWIAAYKYRGESFRFVVNGQSGPGAGRAALLEVEDRARRDRRADPRGRGRGVLRRRAGRGDGRCPWAGRPAAMRESARMILCAGEALIDMLPREVDGATGFLPVPGGAALNTAVAIGRLGAPVALHTGMSNDLFGDRLRAAMAEAGVVDRTARSDRPTTLAFVTLVDGHAEYAFHDEATAGRMLTPADAPDMGGIEALLLGGISLAAEPCGAAFEALAAANGRLPLMLDPNVRPAIVGDGAAFRARIGRLAAMADVVKVSDEDMDWLGTSPADLLAAGASVVCVTEGARGVRAITAGGDVHVPARTVAVVDTVGAGDTFNAGLLTGLWRAGALAKGAPPADALRDALALGVAAAAVTVGRAGANPPWAREL